jgi:predicted HD superfamily hydrolase involved in NAD metabolism
MSSERYGHSLQVAAIAGALAVKFQLPASEARLAGLLHDYARDLPSPELLILARKGGLIKHQVEEKLPVLLHGPVGAWLIRRDLGVDNPDVLEAVALHTVGAAGMSPLAKIVYLADAIEPGRGYRGVNDLRTLAFKDLDVALRAAFKNSMLYVLAKGQLLHPLTVEGWNYLLVERGDCFS